MNYILSENYDATLHVFYEYFSQIIKIFPVMEAKRVDYARAFLF